MANILVPQTEPGNQKVSTQSQLIPPQPIVTQKPKAQTTYKPPISGPVPYNNFNRYSTAKDESPSPFSFILLLLFPLIICGVIAYFGLRFIPPQERTEMPIPVLAELPEFTNVQSFSLVGTTSPNEKILVYINDTRSGEAQADANGKFNYPVKLTKEELYQFNATTYKPLPYPVQSRKSSTVQVTYDNTPPTMIISTIPASYNQSEISIQGSANEKCVLSIQVGDSNYSGETDSNLKFSIPIKLQVGTNKFIITATDLAQNKVSSSEIQIKYDKGSTNGGIKVTPTPTITTTPSVNPTGSVTPTPKKTKTPTKLPDSAGPFDTATTKIFSKILSIVILFIMGLALMSSFAATWLVKTYRRVTK